MPNYDYVCLVCNHRFEQFQKMTDEPLKECPVCQGELKRLIGSGLAPIFKGGGFYQTDYKNSNSQISKAKKDTTEKVSREGK